MLEFIDFLRVAGIGLILAFLHLFFEQTGKKEFTFFLFVFGYMYMTVELLRFLRYFFSEISTFFEWLTTSV
jgi:stage III sporulation protein AC